MSTSRAITALLSFPERGSRRGLIALGTGFLASLLLLAGLASSARAEDRVYWANGIATDANRISYANLDEDGEGGNLDTTSPPAMAGQPRGVAIDTAEGRVYWTNRDASLISFTNVDGPGGAANLSTLATVSHPNAAAIDPVERKIYWANEYTEDASPDTISSANLDTGVGEDLITGGPVVTPTSPMVAPGLGRIYWTNVPEANPTAVGIYSTDLNGDNGEALNTSDATVANPHGLAYDPVEQRIYWANPGTVDLPANVISFADLDDDVRGDLTLNDPTTANRPIGVAIDPQERKIYWANWGNDTIAVANLDDLDLPSDRSTASGAHTLGIGDATPNGARSPVLLKAPSGTGVPTIAGDFTTDSPLTCSEGSWAQDQPASWLYQAPEELAYTWTLNGDAIEAADGKTYTPSEEGEYACEVSATNAAGSDSQESPARTVSTPPDDTPPPPPDDTTPPPRPGNTPPANNTQPPSGSSSPPSASNVTPPPAFGAKTRVIMGVAVRRITGRGRVKVIIRNRNGFEVSAKLSTRASRRVSVSRAFVVQAKGKMTVTLKLSKSLRRLLNRDEKLTLRLTVKVKDPAGGTRTVKKTVLLRLKRA